MTILPMDIIRIIFDYAFYPHQKPYIHVEYLNRVMRTIPRSKRLTCYFKPKPGWIITHEPFFYAFRGQRSQKYCKEEHVSRFLYEEHALNRLGISIRFEICTNNHDVSTMDIDDIG